MRRCEDEKMWRWGRCEDEEDVKMRTCADEKMWRREDVKMRKMWRWGKCEDEKMWRWEHVQMRRCEEEKMWRWGRCEDVKKRRCEDENMWRCEDVKMRRCEDENMCRWEHVKKRRCEDEKMWRREHVQMRKCDDRPLLEEPFAQTLSGIRENLKQEWMMTRGTPIYGNHQYCKYQYRNGFITRRTRMTKGHVRHCGMVAALPFSDPKSIPPRKRTASGKLQCLRWLVHRAQGTFWSTRNFGGTHVCPFLIN